MRESLPNSRTGVDTIVLVGQSEQCYRFLQSEFDVLCLDEAIELDDMLHEIGKQLEVLCSCIDVDFLIKYQAVFRDFEFGRDDPLA